MDGVRASRGERNLSSCEVVDDRFGWLDKPVIYDDARLALHEADMGQFLAIFCQRLGLAMIPSQNPPS